MTEQTRLQSNPQTGGSQDSSLSAPFRFGGTAGEITVMRRSKAGPVLLFRVGPNNVSLEDVAEADLAMLGDFIQRGCSASKTISQWGREMRRLSAFAQYIHRV